MAYEGYLKANGVEIANAARTSRYMENLLPTFGFKGCQDCEGLEAALGASYTTPLADNAPWYDPLMPASGAFYGFYPLSIEGIDDSTREAVTTELVGDGSITNRPRFAGRDIRVNGLLLGATEQAVDTGMAWLNRALSGPCEGTDDCLGGDLEFYSSCPQAQDWSQTPATAAAMDEDFTAEAELWAGSEGGAVNVTSDGIEFVGAVGETFSRQVSGLIPGEPYRLRLLPLTNRFQVTIPESADFHFAHHNLFTMDGVYVVLDFIPLYETITIQITPDFGLSLEITDYDITRMPSFQTVLQTEYDSPGNPSGGWVHPLLPTGLEGQWNFGAAAGVRFDIRATSAPTSYPIGSGPSRVVAYPNSGKVRITLQGTFDGPANAVPITMSTSLGNEVIVREIHNQIGTTDAFYYIFEYDTTTSTGPNTITLESGQAVTVTTTNDATWFINYLLIEQVDESILLEDPNPGLAFERTLRNVVATSGPTTAERFSPTCGAMRRVTFSLRAGVPFHYGTDQFVGNAFGSEAISIPEVDCTFGEPVAYNYVLDPRFTTTTGLTFSGFTGVAVSLDPQAPTHRAADFTGGATTAATMTFTYSLAGVPTLTEGAPYTFGVFLRKDGANAATVDQATLSIVGATTSTTSTSTAVTIPALDSAETWTPVTVTGYAPAAATSFTVTLNITRVAGDGIRASAPMFTFGTDIEGYDESWSSGDLLPGSALFLNGTAPGHASTPDAPALDVVGDIDIRVLVALSDWTPSATQALVSKWNTTGNQRSHLFEVLSTGILRFNWSTAGVATLTADSTVAPTVANGEALWVRVTFDVDNGAAGRTATFYTSAADDGVSWTQLGAPVTTATVTSIFASTAILEVGATQVGTLENASGMVFAAEVRNGIAGTIVANPNFAAQAPGTTSFIDSVSNLWTVTAPAEISGGGTPHDLGYFDGTYIDVDWVGSADASQSVTVPAEDAVVYDPACPPLPDPPAPPSIDDTCLTVPAEWTRYIIDVPDRFVPVTSSADPIATIVTTGSAVRNVRMRFYPADLGPFATCGFEGEMLISYIPANSTVIVDATRRTATLVRAGFDDQSVTHLLYGPDGGPVEWPNLSCGTEYLFMVDVESGADTDSFQVLLDVAVRY